MIKYCIILILVFSYIENALAEEDESFGELQQIEIPFPDFPSLTLEGEEKITREDFQGNKRFRQEDKMALEWQLAEFLSLGGGILKVEEISKENPKGKYETRPFAKVTMQIRTPFLKIKNKIEAEYRMREQSYNSMRYKDVITIIPPPLYGFEPYIQDELRYEPEERKKVNKLKIGFRRKTEKSFEISGYYLLNSAIEESVAHTHIFVL